MKDTLKLALFYLAIGVALFLLVAAVQVCTGHGWGDLAAL